MRTCEVKPGQIWKHFKGNLYRIVCLAYNEANMKDMVVYQAASGGGGIWVRPLIEFLGETEKRGEIPGGVRVVFEERFKFVSEGE